MNTPLRPLRELASLISSGVTPRGGALNYKSNGDVMLIRSQNVRMNSLDLNDVAFINRDIADGMTRTYVRTGDVLLNITGASIGRVASFDLNVPANVNQHVCIIRPRQELLSHKYLSRYLATPAFQRRIANEQHGGTRQALTFSQIGGFEVPLPPLPEQKRIATILDKADAIRRKRQEAIRLTEELLRSAFLDMFGDPVTNPKGWEVRKLGEVAAIATGGTPSRAVGDYYGGKTPWVTTAEVTGTLITSTAQHLTDRGLEESNCKVFPVGTVVLAMYGQGATRGRCGLLGIDAATNQACAAILPSQVLPTSYLFTMLRLRYEELRALGRGGNQPNLNLSLVRGIQVPLPGADLLDQFDRFFSAHGGLRIRAKGADIDIQALQKTLTQRAFTGRV